MRAKGYSLGMVSNAREESIREDLGEAVGLLDVVLGRESVPRKPSPEGILRACEILGVSPGEAYYVGDLRIDAEAARAAGVVAVGVASGFCSRKRIEEYFDLAFENILEFAEWLPKI